MSEDLTDEQKKIREWGNSFNRKARAKSVLNDKTLLNLFEMIGDRFNNQAILIDILEARISLLECRFMEFIKSMGEDN